MNQKSPTGKSDLLAQWKKRKQKKVPSSIAPKPVGTTPLPSSGQQRLWLLQRLYPKNPFYQYGHLYKITGALNIDLLRQSFLYVLNKHEILRTNFIETVQGVELKIASRPSFELPTIDLTHLPPSEQATKAYQLAQENASNYFDLATDLLIRVHALKLSDTTYWLVLSMHHIIGDRSSLLILNEELFAHYQSLVTETVLPTTTATLQYTDYTYWKSTQTINKQHLAYWVKNLSGELPILTLPSDHQRSLQPSFKGGMVKRQLSATLSKKIQQLAKEQQTTLYVILLAAFKVLLYRYTNQTDILVGSPFSNRDKVELERLIGFFNETVVLRTQLSDTLSFKELIAFVKEGTINAFEHKDLPFDALVRTLQPKRHGSNNPLFQVMFVYNSVNPLTYADTSLAIEEEMLDLGVSKFDLTLFVTDHKEYLETTLEFSLDLFEQDSIEQLSRHLEVVLEAITNNPNQLLYQIPLLDAKETEKIAITWNDTAIPLSKETAIHHLIEKQAAAHPQQIAVVFQDTHLSYQTLNEQANKIAVVLLELGVQPNMFIGLYIERSLEMIVGILGILKTGAAYLPLDPEYPMERIEYMLQDANVSIVLTQTKLKNQLTNTTSKVIDLQQALPKVKDQYLPATSSPKKEDLAYIIYTSGSTGKPKGVPITHENLIHSTTTRFHYFDHQPGVFLLLSSFSFDSSVVGLFWTLCSGGTLVVSPHRIEQNMQTLADLISQNKVTHTLLLPSLYQLLLNYASLEKLHTLTTVMVAGEACSSEIVRQHYAKIPTVQLVNEYGPTEGTVWCTAHTILPADAFGQVPIGRPIPNVQNYILDKHLQLVPTGVAGELYIGGAGLAKGYWNRPALTADRFIPHPFREQEKLYKTGDLASYRKNGLIDFLGRADHQVKIRGHRIELEEIQNALLQLDIVQEALVVVQNKMGIPRLIAYLIVKESAQAGNLRSALKERLPAYMIPAAFVRLAEFPTLPNGKIDRSKLPAPDETAFATNKEFIAPSSEIEQQLVTIWEEVLAIKPIGLQDNFFEIGGDSIHSIKVIAKAQQAGIELAPHQLFEYQTIGELAFFLEKTTLTTQDNSIEKSNWSSLVVLNKKGTRPPIFCIHSGGGHVFFYQPLAQLLKEDQPLYALQPAGLDGQQALHNSIEEMAAFYIEQLRSVQPKGPYHLLGTCFSNAVGLEMANQLKAAGEEIALLIFVDSGPAYLLGAAIRGERKTIQRFANFVKDKDWKGIQKKIRNRWIRTKQKALSPLENEQEKNIRLTINSLNKLYGYYTWKPYDGKITFIRSTEFAYRKDKDTHIEQWTKLAKGGLEVHIVEGHHKTLFAEPEVQGLATVIHQCIDKLRSV